LRALIKKLSTILSSIYVTEEIAIRIDYMQIYGIGEKIKRRRMHSTKEIAFCHNDNYSETERKTRIS
jgi:hypothetical protein